ncbi:hypothetical protein ACSL103130_07020 [Actinomyces slackii]|uniref:Uncharacterized protein n=1 Tax=Actinomyces slackii TaxID=52774 RepID=A0A448K9P0_9ACTO|nr:hypothetical protein [Actinomyces slackii]VEG73575.1 Uncharacterised protein [Actinomyces slackii]
MEAHEDRWAPRPPAPQWPGQVPPDAGYVEIHYTYIRFLASVPRTTINGWALPRSSERVQGLWLPAGPVVIECRDTLTGGPRLSFMLAPGAHVPVYYAASAYNNHWKGSLTFDDQGPVRRRNVGVLVITVVSVLVIINLLMVGALLLIGG